MRTPELDRIDGTVGTREETAGIMAIHQTLRDAMEARYQGSAGWKAGYLGFAWKFPSGKRVTIRVTSD